LMLIFHLPDFLHLRRADDIKRASSQDVIDLIRFVLRSPQTKMD
jgi:hypothetical protein